MKTTLLFAAAQWIGCSLYAQSVGINTPTPLRTLSVNGTVMVDQQNSNYGNIDSAALLFGSSNVGIFSNRKVGGINVNGLDIWTNNQRRMTISSGGFVGINLGSVAPFYHLDVNGTIRSKLDLRADDDLAVADNASVGGNLTVSGATIANGNLTVAGSASVGGKGIVRSNSGTNLRMGFSSGAFTITLNPNQTIDITFNIVSFEGDNNDIRVAISQFVPEAGSGDTWGKIVMTVHSVDPVANQCKIRFHNPASSSSTMNGRLYLMSVATD